MLTDEQTNIISHLLEGNNVLVNAVAGSGKTTLILELARCTTKRILQLTYNSLLRLEVKRKNKSQNLDIHTYHSLANLYKRGYTDSIIEYALTSPITKKVHYDIIVIDEAQDMKLLYYHFVQKFIQDCELSPTLLIIGDEFQSIYEFKESDSRFLTLAPQIWKKEFIELPLSTSFRLTNETANFISTVSGRPISTVKYGDTPKYLFGDNTVLRTYVVSEIKLLIESGYKNDDIFILVPSVKGKCEAKKIENLLSGTKVGDNELLFYVSSSDNVDKISDKVIANKILITTIHQAKGRERKIVFVYNFDSSYYQYYARDEIRTECTNTHYVALSRAIDKLYVLHNSSHSVLPYLTQIPKNVQLNRLKDVLIKTTYEDIETKLVYSPTQLLKHVDSYVDLRWNIIKEKSFIIEYNCEQEFTKGNITYTENVADIVGRALPQIFTSSSTNVEILNRVIDSICAETGTFFRKRQITNYDWFTDDLVESALSNFASVIKQGGITVEHKVEKTIIWGAIQLKLFGFIDMIQDNNVYEIKFKSSTEICDQVQLMLYALLMECESPIDLNNSPTIVPKYNYYLFNVKDMELLELRYEHQKFIEILKKIISRLEKPPKLSDESFLQLL